MDTKEDFATRLKSYREGKKITQAQLAAMLDVALSTISNYEQGRSEPPSSNAYKMYAQLMGVSYEWLRWGRGEMCEVVELLHARQEKSHTGVSQTDIGLSPKRDDYKEPHQQEPADQRGPMELTDDLADDMVETIDYYVGGRIVARTQFFGTIPGTRKDVDLDEPAEAVRKKEKKQEGPPPQGE